MSEEENVGVIETQESMGSPETIQSNSVQAERGEDSSAARKRNDAEYNWAEARRKMQESEREKQILQEELNRLRSQTKQEKDYGIKDDDLAEGKHLKSLYKEIDNLKSELERSKAATVEDRLQMKYPDFSDVVTKENIELLKQTEPELAESIYHSPDPYKQAVAAYKLLKKVGVNQEQSMPVEKKKAIENSQKPVSVQAVSKQSAIGNAHLFENGLTKELKDQLWKEMQEIKKMG